MKRTFTALPLLILSLIGCEEILEVRDISGHRVELLAPMDQAIVADSTVNFNWDGIDGATAYLVQVAAPNFREASQIVLDTVLAVDSTFVGTRLAKRLGNGPHEWRVKGANSDFETGFSMAGFSVEVPVAAPNAPQLVAPADGAELATTGVVLRWDREDVKGSVERDSVHIHSDPGLTGPVAKGLGVDGSFGAELPVGSFYWYVRAHNDKGVAGPRSTIYGFTIAQ